MRSNWWEGDFPISQGYGPTNFQFEPSGFGYSHFHTGIDIAAPIGTKIKAAVSGIVRTVTKSTGFGKEIIFTPDNAPGTTIIFGHLSNNNIISGHVPANTVIGQTGTTGNSTGPHLHFEVEQNNTPQNPLSWISGGNSTGNAILANATTSDPTTPGSLLDSIPWFVPGAIGRWFLGNVTGVYDVGNTSDSEKRLTGSALIVANVATYIGMILFGLVIILVAGFMVYRKV